MKIGYITQGLGRGHGGSQYATGITEAVSRLPGFKVKVVTAIDSNIEGLDVFKVLPIHHTYKISHQLAVFYYCLSYLRDCDILHTTFEQPVIGVALASLITGAKFVMTLHGTYAVPPTGYSPKSLIKRSLMRFAHRISAKSTTGSFNTERRVKELIPEMKECRFIPNGYDSKTFYLDQNIKKENHLLTVGNIKDRKGMDIVIKALGLLKNDFPELKYKIIGGDNDKPQDGYYKLLEKIALENGVQDRLEIRVGKITREELAKEYNRCGIFVLTSRDSGGHFEGFPLVYFEAMACGAPVVATKGFGSEYTVKNGKNGFLVGYEDVQGTAEAIRKIMGDRELKSSMSKNAIAMAQTHTWDKISNGYLKKFYEDVVNPDSAKTIKVQFLKPDITDKEIEAVTKILKTGWLVLGNTAEEFENKFSDYLGVKHAILTNSCTTSLHMSLLMAGVGPGDEVITTPLSYVSTANAILYCGATPVFVDVEPDTGLIDATKIENAITSKTKAILPVHLYGQMADMKMISKIAQTHNLAVIEDAAHAIEAKRDGLQPGQAGLTACFSFHVAKNITSGEGGAIVTNHKNIYELAGLLRRDGVRNIGKKRRMEVLGFKYLTTDFQAAMLKTQLERIDRQCAVRRKLHTNYGNAFNKVDGIDFPKTVPNSRHASHMFVVWVNPERRDNIREILENAGIDTSIHYEPIHLEPYYRERFGYKPGDFPIAERLGFSTITLPLYFQLTRHEQDYVIRQVISAVK